MYINVKFNKKYIVIVVITIVVFCSVIALMIGKVNKTIGQRIDFNENEINIENYYASYDMTVVSNKNINTYKVDEWYKEGQESKLEYMDSVGNIVTISLKDNLCSITNSGNIAKFSLENMYENKNIASLSTFMHIYNLIDGNCMCKKTSYKKDNKTCVVVELEEKGICSNSKRVKKLGISKLELIIENKKPLNYIIYDENKKEYISIVYNKFGLYEFEE